MKKYLRHHIGKKFITTEGYECEIIDGGSKNLYCTIKIKNWIIEKRYNSVKNGNIKYPYHKSVFKQGYLGIGKFKSGPYNNQTKEYKIWHGMLKRCYYYQSKKKHKTYINVTVCNEWKNFQIFAEWFNKNYIEKWDLDKDILSKNIKIYSPSTCCFIPRDINSFMTNNKSTNTSGAIGVHFNKIQKKWTSSISIENKRKHLGVFNKKKDAIKSYKLAREKQVKRLQIKYKEIISNKILYNLK